MAKKSKIAKDAQRRLIVARYAERRADLKRRSVDFSLPDAEREAAMRSPACVAAGRQPRPAA